MRFKLLIKNKFVSTILGTIALFFGIAFILPLGNMAVYITSNIHIHQNFVNMHYGLFINLIFMLANTFSASLGGYFENLIGFFKTIILGFAILFISNFFFILQKNIWLCYILTLILGIGAGISSSLLGKNIQLYVPDKKGAVAGAFGFGIMIIVAIFAFSGEKMINFDGETLSGKKTIYSPEVAERTYLYFLIGEFTLPIGFLFALLLLYEYKPEENEKNKDETKKIEESENKPDLEQQIINKDENEKEDKEKKEEENDAKMNSGLNKQKLKKVIKTFRFWRIVIISLFINITISYMVNTGSTFGAIIGIDGNALQFAGIIQTLATLVIGPVLGILVDKIGPLIILRIIAISTIIPGFLLAFWMENTVIFISCFVFYVLCIVGLMVSFSPFIMEVYGIQESVILGGFINGISKIGDVITTICPFSFSLICDEDNKECLKDKYRIMYLISSIGCTISALLLFFESLNKFVYDEIPSDSLNNGDQDIGISEKEKNRENNENEKEINYENKEQSTPEEVKENDEK